MEEYCPICYDAISDINVCVTPCKHKFHTNCLMIAGNICPMCRTNITSKSPFSKIPPGIYNMSEFIQQLNQSNISIDNISPTAKEWIEECKEHDRMMKEIEKLKQDSEEERKNNLKKTDINK